MHTSSGFPTTNNLFENYVLILKIIPFYSSELILQIILKYNTYQNKISERPITSRGPPVASDLKSIPTYFQ